MTDGNTTDVRIWHQSFTVLEDLPAYRDLLKEHLHRVARPGVTLDLHGMLPGTYPSSYPGTHIQYHAMQHLHKEQFIRSGLEAQKQGYDAYMIATIPDTAYEEVRTLLDIPVIALGQASLALASTLGDRVGIVNFIEPLALQLRRNARLYGLGELLGPVIQIDAQFTDILAAYADAGPLISAFQDAARKAIADGANVIVPGEGPLNVFLADQGISRVDDVPVIDSLGASLKMCEVRVDLHRSGQLRPGGRGYYYARPPEGLFEKAMEFYQSSFQS